MIGEADDDRRGPAGDDDRVGLGERDDGEREIPPQDRHRTAHRLPQAGTPGDLRLDEVGDHLGVRVRYEHVAVGDERCGEFAVVLDDAVVHDGDGPGAVDLRVGVALARRPVGRPARAPDGRAPVTTTSAIIERNFSTERVSSAMRHDAELARFRVDEGDPGRVVAAVLE